MSSGLHARMANTLVRTIFPLPVLRTFKEMGWEPMQAAGWQHGSPEMPRFAGRGSSSAISLGLRWRLRKSRGHSGDWCCSMYLSCSVTLPPKAHLRRWKEWWIWWGKYWRPWNLSTMGLSFRVMVRRYNTLLCLGETFSKYLLGPFDLWYHLRLYVFLVPSLWLLFAVCF